MPHKQAREGIRWRCRQNFAYRPRNFRRAYTSTYSTTHKQKSFRRHFFKNKASMLLSKPSTFFFQETHFLTPRLVHALRTMSIAKAVPKGIKDHECKRFALQEPPPVPYVPEKNSVQEMVFLLKSDQSLETTIRADAELCLPIWHCGMRKAFLMHVSSALDAIKKKGTFLTRKPKRLM